MITHERQHHKECGKLLIRMHIPGFKVIPKPGFSRRSEETEAYHKQQWELANQFATEAVIQKTKCPLVGVAISFVATYTDRRVRDWSNVCKAIEDALVKSGIVDDDHVKIIVGADRCRVRLGSKSPGLVVELREDTEDDE